MGTPVVLDERDLLGHVSPDVYLLDSGNHIEVA
jgi:hypothetical protein